MIASKSMITILLIVFTYLNVIFAYNVSPPTWLTSFFLRAGNEAVIKTKTGQGVTSSYTFTFSSALPSIPKLAYGIKGYEGNDFLGQENFQIIRVGLTAGTFSVTVEIFGITNVNILNVAYLAIDPNFPEHLNTFDNVPINYTSGPLVNISTKTSAPTKFTEVINYSLQSAGMAFTTFQTPLVNNKILMFLTSLFVRADFKSGSTYYPVQITTTYSIINTTHYSLTANIYTRTEISRLHFSQIVFNQQQIQSSDKYFVEYLIWTVDVNGGFYSFPQQFTDNFIMALTNFKTVDGKCGIQYQWDFITNSSGIYGVNLKPSFITYGDCGLNTQISTIFYLKTWICNPPFLYFNQSTQQCQDGCPSAYYGNTTNYTCQVCDKTCANCTSNSSSSCTNCDINSNRQLVNGSCLCKSGYYDDGSNATCQSCSSRSQISSIGGCIDCQKNSSYIENNTDPNNIYIYCTKCDTGYIVVDNVCEPISVCNNNNFLNTTTNECVYCPVIGCDMCSTISQCSICLEAYNYFLNSTDSQCQQCSLPHCLICQSLTQCQICDQSSKYYLNDTNKMCQTCTLLECVVCSNLTFCLTCSNSTGYFLNTTNSLCQLCNISNCDKCSSLLQCQQCSASYLLNSSKLCESCPLSNCIQCQTLTQCQVCNQSSNYFLNSSTKLCDLCSLSQCLTCKSLTQCNICNTSSGYFLNFSNGQCQTCTLTGCLVCYSQNNCSIADQANNYFLNSSNIPTKCVIEGCLNCSSLLSCSTCDISSGYLYNSTTFCCDRCSLQGCLTCSTLTQCSICDHNLNYFLNSSSKLCEKCSLQGCLNCSTAYKCTECSQFQGYSLDLTAKECKKCELQGCKICQSFQKCSQCLNQQNFFLNSETNICKKCQIQGCSKCSSINSCEICNQSQYYFNHGIVDRCYNTLFPFILSYMILGTAGVGILIMFCLKSSLVTIQIVSAIQLAYLALANSAFMHPYLKMLLNIKPVTGLHFNFIDFSWLNPQKLDKNIGLMDYTTSFLENNWIMIIFQIVALVMVLIFFILYKIHEQNTPTQNERTQVESSNIKMYNQNQQSITNTQDKPLSQQKYPKQTAIQRFFRFVQKQAFVLTVFNAPNFIFCSGLLNIDMRSALSYLQYSMIIMYIMILSVYTVHFLWFFHDYFEVKQTFRKHTFKYFLWFIGLLVCRLLCSILLSTLREQKSISALVILIIQISFLIIYSGTRVYRRALDVILNILIQITLLVDLTVCLIGNFFATYLEGYFGSYVQDLLAWIVFICVILLIVIFIISVVHSFIVDYLLSQSFADYIQQQQSIAESQLDNSINYEPSLFLSGKQEPIQNKEQQNSNLEYKFTEDDQQKISSSNEMGDQNTKTVQKVRAGFILPKL